MQKSNEIFFFNTAKTFPVNGTHREKLCFTQFSIRMAAWLLLTFSICLHNQLSSIYLIITYVKCYHIHIDSKNEWLLYSESFTAKFELVFVLTLKNASFWRFHFKPNRKNIGSSKKWYQEFSK